MSANPHRFTAVQRFTELLGVATPIVCAPMGGIAGGALATAVSRAGALGMIGMGSAGSVATLDQELARLDVDEKPFGIGLVDWVLRQHPDLLDRSLAAKPTLLAVSFADWSDTPAWNWVEVAHRHGTLAATQVATAEEAKLAVAAGVDLIVARGLEAGGHGDPAVSLAPLLQETIAAVQVPVLAAGAVATGADLQRVFAAGAAGAWLGTAFAACPESLASDAVRTELLRVRGEDTIVTHVLDAALGYPWPHRFPERLISTPFVTHWHGREEELRRDPQIRAEFQRAVEAEDYSVVPLDAGMGVGTLTESISASEVISRLTTAQSLR